MTQPLTQVQFAQQLGFMAKEAASWSADMLGPSEPGELDRPVAPHIVENFVGRMWHRLDRLIGWEKSPPDGPGIQESLYHHAICGTVPNEEIAAELALRGLGAWMGFEHDPRAWVWDRARVEKLNLTEARTLYHRITAAAAVGTVTRSTEGCR